MSGPGDAADAADLADLPGRVAATRDHLEELLRRLDPAGAPASGGAVALPPRPVIGVVGAPGRGRHGLVAALLGLPALPPGTARVGHEAGAGGQDALGCAVPLLEELDLAVPPHRDDGHWPTGGTSALLVLADAAAPLDRDELAALTAAADRVEGVLLALVHTDRHRGWRTVLDADRELVAEHVPRLAGASWYPVAADLAHRARDADAALAAALRERSGIAPLQRALHRLVARRRRVLAEANALRTLAGHCREVAERAALTRDALGADDDAALRRRRDELDAARTDLRRGRHVRWRSGLATARVAATDDLATRVRALSATTRRRVDEADRAELAAIPARVAADLERLTAAVVAGLGEQLRDLLAATLTDLLPPGELAALRVPAPAPVAPPPGPDPRGRAEDRLLVVAGASGGLGLSRLALLPLITVPVLGAALVPVSVGLGLGAAGWLARSRRLAADRARLRQWLAEALAQARADLDRVLADALIATEREVTLALDEALDRRARDLAAAAGALDTDRRRAAEDRAAARRDADRTVREATDGAARAEALLARMAGLLARG